MSDRVFVNIPSQSAQMVMRATPSWSAMIPIEMSKGELALRQENCRQAELIERLMRELATKAPDPPGYGEQGGEEPVPVKSFPARALRYQDQKIGLFTFG